MRTHEPGTRRDAPGTTNSLRHGFGDRLHLPGDEGYEAARLAWRRNLDPHPAMIVEATTTEDIRIAVLSAQERGLPLGVQATGHGAVRPANGGLLLKTNRMTAVTVDPEQRRVVVQPGALWSDVITAAAPFGLAPLSGSSVGVGVTGYTLGGGAGWLSRTYGFAADNLLRANIVTAGGQFLTASANEHPDLFWAIRGGGGNFGIVTEMEFRVFPVTQVYARMGFYPVEQARTTLATYRDWAIDEPDALSTAVTLLQMPSLPGVPEPIRGKQVLALRALALTDADEAERLLEPLLGASGSPILGHAGTMTFAEAGMTLAGPPPPPMIVRQHIDLFRTIPDDLIDTMINAMCDEDGSPLTAIELRHWGGAMNRPAVDAGPVGHRDVPFSVIGTAVPDGSGPPEAIDTAVADLASWMRPHATGGTFLNFLGDPAQTATAYTPPDYRRLRAVKAAYDRDNVFGINHNIPPAEQE
jgi:FAD/FMN-containing dehydrogenase